MWYKIGDVAKILGISPDLLRYYEKKGVVRPTKDRTNDYRYYDFWDINFLLDCLWFKNFGFPLDQVAGMVNSLSAGELDSMFRTKEDELRATIARCELLLARSQEHRQDLQKAQTLLGRCEITDSPAYIRYLNRYTDNFDNSPALQKLSHDWLNLMPFTHRCFEFSQKALLDEEKDYSWGLSLRMNYVEKLHVPTDPPVVYIPPAKSLHSVFQSAGKGNFSPRCITYLVDYCREHNLTITGPARGNLLCSAVADGVLTGYFEVWLAVQ